MKYVVFKQGNTFHPIVFPESVTHSMVKIDEATPVSAGFFYVDTLGQVTVSDRASLSLNLSPHKRDKELLEATLGDYGTIAFIDWDTLYRDDPPDSPSEIERNYPVRED